MSPNNRVLLRELAARQHGVVAIAQARSLCSRSESRAEFDSELWTPVFRGVYQLTGSPPTLHSRAMGKLLRAGPGAAVSHYSALDLWGVVRGRLDPLHIIRMRAGNGVALRADGIVRHETRRMPTHHITTHLGFLTATPARAFADVAATTATGRLERWLDRAWSMRLVSFQALTEVVIDLNKRGRRGIAQLADLVYARGPEYVPPASGLETRLNYILGKANLPRVLRQVHVGGEEWLGRVDFRLEGTPILIEAQSDMFHASLSSTADDQRRFAALKRERFFPVAIWESQIWGSPHEVVAIVHNAMSEIRR